MHIAMLSPIAWRTPPEHYGPWELVVSLLTEGLVSKGVTVTLFATENSITDATLHAVCPRGYEEDRNIDPKVFECLHISELFERADEFDLIHNHFDFLPLSYSKLVATPVICTIHGFSSSKIIPVYEKYNSMVEYISISNADRSSKLQYLKTIHHGIDLKQFTFQPAHGEYLLFLGRIHPDKGTKEAIEIGRQAGMKLILAGIIQDKDYFKNEIEPHLDGRDCTYIGCVNSLQRNKLLGGAYALLHPINFNEPFGLSIIEAMACGTPVIANNRGSMSELIQNAKNGFLVSSLTEALVAIKNIPGINRADCRKTVEDSFTVETMVNNYIEAYTSVIEKNKRENRRPWGFYRILEYTASHKTKRIVVYPGKRLSLQRHQKREEHWIILSGEGEIILNNETIKVEAGLHVFIPKKAIHRIENTGSENIVFIETAVGEYLGEDDIERIDDDYGRHEAKSIT